MNLLFENWRRYLNEATQTEIYKFTKDLHKLIFDEFKNNAIPTFNSGKRHYKFIAKQKDEPIKNNIPNPYNIDVIIANFEWAMATNCEAFLKSQGGNPWMGGASWDPKPTGLEFMVNYTFAVPAEDFDFNQYLEKFNQDLFEKIGHELTHAKQYKEKGLKDDGGFAGNLGEPSGIKKYYLDPREKEAFIRGMYFKARRTKTDLQKNIETYFEAVFNDAVQMMKQDFEAGQIQPEDAIRKREELLRTIILITKEYQAEAKSMYGV